MKTFLLLWGGVFILLCGIAQGAIRPGWAISDKSPGGKALQEYFEKETAKLEKDSLSKIRTKADWEKQRPIRLQQLKQMLGVPNVEPRPKLNAKVTGTVEKEEFVVEKVHFQSLPGLYVTGNLYRPRNASQKLPAILYVCGHGRVKVGGVSMGNKTHYQHHGAWFAQNGYVCLTIDTIQLGEIEGYHHGTYYGNKMWWLSRGYTPAGVEAWNGIRAIDYLQSRPEVDGTKIGVTGRSGGGSYSWWISALDERVKISVPVAGIANLRNHVVDGCVEGHCDCMYMVNTQRWDYADVAAMVAPRKLLISNTDNDPIFPLDGVVETYTKARRIYELLGVEKNIGLHITEGPHQDTQPLRMGAFHWFNKHLKGKSDLVSTTAEKLFKPEELKVFEKLPKDERTSTIHDSFVPMVNEPELPKDAESWKQRGESLKQTLRSSSFGGWPKENSIAPKTKRISQAVHEGVRLQQYEFTAQDPFQLPLFVLHREGLQLEELDLIVLNVLDEAQWQNFLAWAKVGFSKPLHNYPAVVRLNQQDWAMQKKMFENFKWGMAYFAPRGVGPTKFTDNDRKHIQIQRRFYLLGQTLEGMQTWDTRQASKAIREIPGLANTQIWMQAEGNSAAITLYASLYEKDIYRLDLHKLPSSHMEGPQFLNILRHTNIPEAVAHAATQSQIRIYPAEKSSKWEFPASVSKKLGWSSKQFKVVSNAETNQ